MKSISCLGIYDNWEADVQNRVKFPFSCVEFLQIHCNAWGQGIQKICDECTALGAELPNMKKLELESECIFRHSRVLL